MTTQDNITIGRALLDALTAHDLSPWEAVLADDVVCSYPGFRGEHGKDAAKAYNAPFLTYQRRKRSTIACVTLLIMTLFVAACSTTLPPPGSAMPTTSAAGSTLSSMTPAPPTLLPTRVTPTPNPTLVAGLIGLWKGDNGSFYLFNQDGTWNWDQQRDRVEQAPENRGTWWIEGDVFNIVDLSGKEPCPRNQIGRYQMQFAGDALILRRVNDLCRERVSQTAGTYSRLSGTP